MNIKRILSLRFIKWIMMPFIFFLFWVIVSLVFASRDPGITILQYFGSRDNLTRVTYNELLAGDVIKGQLEGVQDNLGIVSIRFNTFYRINDDQLIFRIKQKGSQDWYYENKYKVDQFQPDDFFTFGFPVIRDSKGKIYEFELESTLGKNGDAVAISTIDPVMVSKYEFSRQYLMVNRDEILSFISNKARNLFSDQDFAINSLICLIPLLIYFYKILLFDKYLSRQYVSTLFPILLIFIVSFFVNITNYIIVLVILGLWILTMIAYRLEGRISYFFALIFLSVGAVLLLFDQVLIAESLSIWAYWFMLIGALRQVWEIKREHNNLVPPALYLKKSKLYVLFSLVLYLIKLFKKLIIIFAKKLWGILKNIIILIKKIKNLYVVKSHKSSEYVRVSVSVVLTLILIYFLIYKAAYPYYVVNMRESARKYVNIRNTEIFIENIEPKYIHLADKVVINGSGFNVAIGKHVRIMTSQGEVEADFAAPKQLIFTVPLTWRPGGIKIWLENNGLKSNTKDIILFERLGDYSVEDLLYYSQIKFLGEDARGLNQFRNYKFGNRYVGKLLILVL